MTKNLPHLILTVDYELFGDGSGCIDQCIVTPAEKILKIANQYSAKVTFFTDAIEFIKMGQEKEFDEAINRVKKQLSGSVHNGHDVQLHVHPQWLQANYLNHQWKVDFNAWRIADLKQEEILFVFKESIHWLDNVISSDNLNYTCNAFRAGGWCIQPSEKVIQALQQIGIKIDSTVAPGFRNLSQGEWSDFSNVPNEAYWLSNRDVCNDSASGIIEVPIATGKIGKFHHLNVIRNAKKQGMAQNCMGSYQGPDQLYQKTKGKLGKLLHLGNVMLDFSTMPSDVLIAITKQWIEQYSSLEKTLPIVAIAHTKNFTKASEIALEEYLSWAKDENLIFSTYSDWLDAINE